MRKKLIIKTDEFTIYQIRPEYVQELKHIPEQDIKGFEHLISFRSTETYTPIYHQKEQWYAEMTNGKRIYLTKKQYEIIKKWFEELNK